MELLCFLVDQHRYALELQHVVRVLPAAAFNPLAQGPGILLGAINVQGQALGLVNLRERLGLPSRALRLSDKLVWIRLSKLGLLLPVDDIADVLHLQQPTLANPADFPQLPPLVGGIVILQDGLLCIQNPTQLLNLQEQQEAEHALASG